MSHEEEECPVLSVAEKSRDDVSADWCENSSEAGSHEFYIVAEFQCCNIPYLSSEGKTACLYDGFDSFDISSSSVVVQSCEQSGVDCKLAYLLRGDSHQEGELMLLLKKVRLSGNGGNGITRLSSGRL